MHGIYLSMEHGQADNAPMTHAQWHDKVLALNVGQRTRPFRFDTNHPTVYVRRIAEKGLCLHAGEDIQAQQQIFPFAGILSNLHESETQKHLQFVKCGPNILKRPEPLLYDHAAWAANDANYDGLTQNNAQIKGTGATVWRNVPSEGAARGDFKIEDPPASSDEEVRKSATQERRRRQAAEPPGPPPVTEFSNVSSKKKKFPPEGSGVMAGVESKFWIFSIRSIKKNEEILCDYGLEYDIRTKGAQDRAHQRDTRSPERAGGATKRAGSPRRGRDRVIQRAGSPSRRQSAASSSRDAYGASQGVDRAGKSTGPPAAVSGGAAVGKRKTREVSSSSGESSDFTYRVISKKGSELLLLVDINEQRHKQQAFWRLTERCGTTEGHIPEWPQLASPYMIMRDDALVGERHNKQQTVTFNTSNLQYVPDTARFQCTTSDCLLDWYNKGRMDENGAMVEHYNDYRKIRWEEHVHTVLEQERTKHRCTGFESTFFTVGGVGGEVRKKLRYTQQLGVHLVLDSSVKATQLLGRFPRTMVSSYSLEKVLYSIADVPRRHLTIS
jgi:hypothetical protein